MKTSINCACKWLATAAFVGTTACSKIAFAPAPGSELAGNTTASTEILPDGSQKDTFVFNQNGLKAKVDVLMIDDNSGSMADKQTKLGTAFSSFINSLGLIDWQLGITTTDTSTGTYGIRGSLLPFAGAGTKILTKNVANYEGVFLNTIQRPEVGSGDERGMLAIIEAIAKKDTDNAGMFRTNADLAVVILTDEDEGSTGGLSVTHPQEVVNAFQTAFGNSRNLTVYSISIAPTDHACYNASVASGSSYANLVNGLVNLTGGVTGSICDNDYGPALADIGNRVLAGVRTATLTRDPKAGTLQINVNPVDPTLTWSLNGRTVVFNKPPAKGTVLEVTYKPL